MGYTLAEWQARTTAVCNEFEPRQAAVVAQLGVPETPEDVVALVNALTPVVNDYVEALNRVRVPDERRDDALRTYEVNTANSDWAATAREAALNRNQAGYEFAVGKIEAQSNELRALLVDLGVPACAAE